MWPEFVQAWLNRPRTVNDTLAALVGRRVPAWIDEPPEEYVDRKLGWSSWENPVTLGSYTGTGIYLHPRLLENQDRPPSEADMYYTLPLRNSMPVEYVLGHEYGHAAHDAGIGRDSFRDQFQSPIPGRASEAYAGAFGDAFNLVRATASPSNYIYGPEVKQSLARLAPGAEEAFRYILAQKIYEQHPLRGWGKVIPAPQRPPFSGK